MDIVVVNSLLLALGYECNYTNYTRPYHISSIRLCCEIIYLDYMFFKTERPRVIRFEFYIVLTSFTLCHLYL